MPRPPFARQCQHVLNTGCRCKAPALRGLDFCHWHRVANQHATMSTIPLLEDGNSVQIALTQTIRGIKSGEISAKQGTAMLYGLAIASSNLKRVHTESEMYPSEETTAAMHPLLFGASGSPAPGREEEVRCGAAALGREEEVRCGAAALGREMPALPETKDDSTTPPVSVSESEPSLPVPVSSVNADLAPSPSPERAAQIMSADPVPKIPPARSTLSDAELDHIRRVLRQGPRHPDFARCARLLDAHIASKSTA